MMFVEVYKVNGIVWDKLTEANEIKEASSSYVKVFEFLKFFLYMLLVCSCRLQKAKLKVGEWAFFLR